MLIVVVSLQLAALLPGASSGSTLSIHNYKSGGRIGLQSPPAASRARDHEQRATRGNAQACHSFYCSPAYISKFLNNQLNLSSTRHLKYLSIEEVAQRAAAKAARMAAVESDQAAEKLK